MKQLALVRIAVSLLVWAQWMAPLRPTHHIARTEVVAVSVLVWVGSGLLLFGVGSRFAAAVTGLGLLFLSVLGGVQGWQAGGLPLSSLEGWMLGVMVLGLAFRPCGAAWSVDAWTAMRREDASPAVENGGLMVWRVLLSAVLAGLFASHLDVAVTAARIEQVLWARYAAVPLPGVSLGVAIGLLGLEGVGALAVWNARLRLPALATVGVVVLLAYPALYLGAFPVVLATLAFGALSPAEGDAVARIVRGPRGVV
jgi:hypothetical protein